MSRPYYSEANIAALAAGLRAAHGQLENLTVAILDRTYNSPKAEEYSKQGFLRRVQIMVRCIDVVFGILPPNRAGIPSRDELSDAIINIQAFVFNMVGSMDNLAWIWLHERGQKQKDGSDFPTQHVGLGPGNKSFRRTLPGPFRAKLNGFVAWFRNIEDYRHALAHRIPLYIPPFTVRPTDVARYNEIAVEKHLAMQRRDADAYDRLDIEEETLGLFQPFILHAFDESTPILIHFQMLTDFATLADVAAELLNALEPT